jgi:hypothetical protein
VTIDTGPVAVLDGRDSVGQVLTARAAEEALRRASGHGVGAVGVRNSNHFGTAAYFTRMAPPAGAIAIPTTNASAAMAPWGADGSGKSARIPGQSPLRPAGTASRMTDTLLMTRAGVERVVRFAFELAGNRSGAPADGVSRVTCVDKSYVLRSYAFFRAVFDEVALE